MLATGSKVKTSIDESIPNATFIREASVIKATTEVTGVTALKSVWPVNLWVKSKLSKRVWESISVPPKETKFPFEYWIVNLPSLSEVEELSVESADQLSFSSMNTSAPEIYPSTTTPLVFLYPSTVTDADLLPPSPVQVIEKELSPGVEIVISSEPDVDVWEVQSAEQEEVFVEDQDKVVVFSRRTESGFADKVTVGDGVIGAELPPSPPPPPPPPQDIRSIIEVVINMVFFIV